MRPINNFALHACAAAVLTAFAATGAAAQLLGDSTPGATDAARDGQTLYLALGDSIPGATGAIKNDGRGGGWIEIERWDWGETQACCNGIDYLMRVTHMPSRDPDRPLVAGRIPNAGVEREMKKSGKIGENAPASGGGVRVAGGDVDGDGRADVGASKTVTVGGSRSAGQATGKRQHKPLRTRPYVDTSTSAGGGVGDFTRDGKASGMTPYFNPKELGVNKPVPWKSHTQKQPLQSGSLIVRGKFPGCAVGTRYPTLTLVGKDQRYVLHDAVVTSCAAAGDSLPMEEVSFNYASYRGSPVRQSPK